MSAVLAGARREERRSRSRAVAAVERVAERAPRWHEPSREEELREELLVAAQALPPRLALSIRLRLSGLDAVDARVVLCIEFAVGPEHARRIDREAVAALRSALVARGS